MADDTKKFTTRIKKKPMPTTKTPPKKEVVEAKKEKEITKRLTIDLPQSAYIAMKMHVLQEGVTAKGYIKDLIIKDLGL